MRKYNKIAESNIMTDDKCIICGADCRGPICSPCWDKHKAELEKEKHEKKKNA